MSSSNRSSSTTTNNAFDNRTFIDDRDFTRIETNDNREYDIDNSIHTDIRNDIDNSVHTDIRNDIDQSVRNDIDNRVIDSHNTTNEIDNSIELGEQAIFSHGDVTVNHTETDLGAIEAAFDFTEESFGQIVDKFGDVISLERAQSSAALSDLSTTIGIGGIVAGVSVAAIAAYFAWNKKS